MKPGDAVMRLTRIGFRLRLDGEAVKIRWDGGNAKPDFSLVRPLLEVIKQHKQEVREFLRCYCPTCGGVVFGTFADEEKRCLACYYQALKNLNLGLEYRH